MNFDDTLQEAAFRSRARAWLDAHVPREFEHDLKRSAYASVDLSTLDQMAVCKDWQKAKFDAGWAALDWPKLYGGADASPMECAIWRQEEGVFGKLSDPFFIGLGMCGPTIMKWAQEERRQALLPRLASGEDIWCQLFSEPAAGSDLAGIRARAAPDGIDWIINGQKIWTSGAKDAAWGLLLTRTDPDVAKHRGLTMFYLRMDTPGIEVRPIHQMNDDSHFNEVYFTDVRIPDAHRLGAVGQGWQVALTTLMSERAAIGGTIPTGFEELLRLCATLRTTHGPAVDNPAVRSRLANFAVRASGLRYIGLRGLSALSQGHTPGPESSIGKLVAATLMQEIAKFALDLEGEAGMIDDAAYSPDGRRFQALFLRSPAARIEGGSDEILRNIIAERVLNLPVDFRSDKNVPFNQIPTSNSRTATR